MSDYNVQLKKKLQLSSIKSTLQIKDLDDSQGYKPTNRSNIKIRRSRVSSTTGIVNNHQVSKEKMIQQVMQITILDDQEKWKTISSKQKLKLLFESLETIIKYECQQPERITKILEKLEPYLYLNMNQLLQKRDLLMSVTTNPKIKQLFTISDGHIPIKDIYLVFLNEIINSAEQVKNIKIEYDYLSKKTQVDHDQLNKKIQEKSGEIEELKKTIEVLKQQNKNQRLQDIITSLQESVKELQQQNEKNIQENYELFRQNNQLLEQINTLNEIIQSMKNDHKDKSKEMEEHIKKFKVIERKINNFKDIFDKGVYKMVTFRNEIRQLQDNLGDLYTENSILSKRAAVNYSELTPRPNYRELFPKYSINFEQFTKENDCTTESIINWLLSNVQRLYEGSILYQKVRNSDLQTQPIITGSPEKKPKKSGNKKLQDSAQEAVQEFVTMKQQINKIQLNEIPKNVYQ